MKNRENVREIHLDLKSYRRRHEAPMAAIACTMVHSGLVMMFKDLMELATHPRPGIDPITYEKFGAAERIKFTTSNNEVFWFVRYTDQSVSATGNPQDEERFCVQVDGACVVLSSNSFATWDMVHEFYFNVVDEITEKERLDGQHPAN